MRFLAEHGYRTIFLREWIQGKIKPEGKTLAITFDDGYLDNWVYAYPILKKYGMKATIFVPTVRPLENSLRRPNLEDVWTGNCQREDLPQIVSNWEANYRCVLREEGSPDFLTWEEMRQMEASGCIDIQSHSHYHRDFFVSDQIVDFNQNKYFGLGWATDGDTRYGIPIYPRKSALVARRYYDDPRLRDFMAERVGGAEYFSNRRKRDYMKQLLTIVAEYKRNNKLRDRYETTDEQKKRIFSEMALSKRMIEEKLEKVCDLICWPWGEYCELSIAMAQQAGYRGAVSFSKGVNIRAQNFSNWRIRRFAPPRNIEEFVETLSTFSSPIRSYEEKWKSWMYRNIMRFCKRVSDRTFLIALKRKVFRYS